RDDSPRDGLAAEPGLPRLHLPRPHPDGLGLRPLVASRDAAARGVPLARPACDAADGRLLHAVRLPVAIHRLERDRRALPATRLSPARALPGPLGCLANGDWIRG